MAFNPSIMYSRPHHPLPGRIPVPCVDGRVACAVPLAVGAPCAPTFQHPRTVRLRKRGRPEDRLLRSPKPMAALLWLEGQGVTEALVPLDSV